MIYGYEHLDLSPEDRALCDYAAKLTRTPGAMDESDVADLRRHGFDDEQVTLATQVVSFFNFINRIADGLGVDPEDWMEPPEDEWRAERAAREKARSIEEGEVAD